jgi:hypothetical protein
VAKAAVFRPKQRRHQRRGRLLLTKEKQAPRSGTIDAPPLLLVNCSVLLSSRRGHRDPTGFPLRTHKHDARRLGSSQDAVASCQASFSASAAAAAAILAATSFNDDSAVSNPDREASRGLTSRRASKVVP